MGNALQAAQAQNAVTSQFDELTGANEKTGPDPEEQKAKQRMREERDKRNSQEYAEKKANHAANKKKLSAQWAQHKKANSSK